MLHGCGVIRTRYIAWFTGGVWNNGTAGKLKGRRLNVVMLYGQFDATEKG
jgi:hypothetical protein